MMHLLGWPNFIRRIQRPHLFSFLDIKRGERVLDLGCGEGQLTIEIASRGADCVGVDLNLSPHANEMMHFKNLKFIRAEAHKLPFGVAEFDAILLSSVLQVVESPEALLAECLRVLKPSGRLVLSVPEDYLYIKYLYGSRYSELKRRIGQRFRVKGREYFSHSELKSILGSNWIIQHSVHAPGPVGSFIFEILLWTRLLVGWPRLTSRYDILLLPLTWIDRFLPKRWGCEAIYLARPVNSNSVL